MKSKVIPNIEKGIINKQACERVLESYLKEKERTPLEDFAKRNELDICIAFARAYLSHKDLK